MKSLKEIKEQFLGWCVTNCKELLITGALFLIVFGGISLIDHKANADMEKFLGYSEDGFRQVPVCLKRGEPNTVCPLENMTNCWKEGECLSWTEVWLRDDCTMSKHTDMITCTKKIETSTDTEEVNGKKWSA